MAEAAADERIALVHQAEIFARMKSLPPLSRFLKRKPERRRQSPDEMLAVFKGLHAAGAPMSIRRRD